MRRRRKGPPFGPPHPLGPVAGTPPEGLPSYQLPKKPPGPNVHARQHGRFVGEEEGKRRWVPWPKGSEPTPDTLGPKFRASMGGEPVTPAKALEQAFEALGGVEGLVAWARNRPTRFYTMWSRLLPKDITLSGGATLGVVVLPPLAKLDLESRREFPVEALVQQVPVQVPEPERVQERVQGVVHAIAPPKDPEAVVPVGDERMQTFLERLADI